MAIKLVLDVEKTKLKHLRQLEKTESVNDFVNWLVEHCGANLEELDEISLAELPSIKDDLRAAVEVSLALPKAKSAN